MKTGQSSANALSLSRILEISKEANSLSTVLADMGRCTKTQLAHVDSALLTSRGHGSRESIGETGHRAPAGGSPLPSNAG